VERDWTDGGGHSFCGAWVSRTGPICTWLKLVLSSTSKEHDTLDNNVSHHLAHHRGGWLTVTQHTHASRCALGVCACLRVCKQQQLFEPLRYMARRTRSFIDLCVYPLSAGDDAIMYPPIPETGLFRQAKILPTL